MQKKKGQITIFIIIGIIIISIFLFIFIIKENNIVKNNIQSTPEIQSISLYIDSCLSKTALDGIYLVGQQGGYSNTSKPFYSFSDIKIPIYYNLNEKNIPTIKEIENQVSLYIENNIETCLDNLSAFKQMGYTFEFGKIKVKTSINSKNIVIDMHYPLKIIKGNKITPLEKFNDNINFDFYRIYEQMIEITNQHETNPNFVNIGKLSYLAYENNFQYEVGHLKDNYVLYSLIFNKSINNEPFIYSFMIRYNWNQTPEEENTVIIEPIPEINITSEDLINYQVRAYGNNLTFYDYTDLFNIGQFSGYISFYPTNIGNGKKHVLIKAIDSFGNEDYEYLTLNVNITDKSPAIEPIKDKICYVGQECVFQINVTSPKGEYLGFLDDTTLFDIHPLTGLINFTPTTNGNYSIKITAVNLYGHSFENMRLEII